MLGCRWWRHLESKAFLPLKNMTNIECCGLYRPSEATSPGLDFGRELATRNTRQSPAVVQWSVCLGARQRGTKWAPNRTSMRFEERTEPLAYLAGKPLPYHVSGLTILVAYSSIGAPSCYRSVTARYQPVMKAAILIVLPTKLKWIALYWCKTKGRRTTSAPISSPDFRHIATSCDRLVVKRTFRKLSLSAVARFILSTYEFITLSFLVSLKTQVSSWC